MKRIIKVFIVVFFFVLVAQAQAQVACTGKVIDGATKEPIAHASVAIKDQQQATMTNSNGVFTLWVKDTAQQLVVSFSGYQSVTVAIVPATPVIIPLQVAAGVLPNVVVSANRDISKRAEAPVAISTISAKVIADTKPATIDQVLNKVSGVYMVNLGNEQHMMSIRQPMTTKSLFLYLEDGIPIRTTGLFNHNALLEMNMAAVRTIEVIKGPSSSLYGSEAIGGAVNFITVAPTAVPTLKISLQNNNIGYRRGDLQTGFTSGKWGVSVSGYYANRSNSYIDYSDFHKTTGTVRIDYRFSDKTTLSNGVTWLNYYSDMPGGIDSAKYAGRSFSNPQTFTYRKVEALRYHSTLNHVWNANSKTAVSVIFRDNTIGQNPAYAIKDDYRKQGNAWTGNKAVAHGEINAVTFNSYALIAQHKQQLHWKDAVLIGGVSVDLSPSTYQADYIRIRKDTVSGKYLSYEKKDSVLTNYRSNVNNYAAYINFELSPVNKLRLVTSLRYDLFTYRFDNHLAPSAYSGSPDTTNHFKAISPKVGFTYNFTHRLGLYANYSQGFVPPQVTEMYKGVKVPAIKSSVFYNYEAGGWAELVPNKLSTDLSVYYLSGTNEIVAVRLEDGSTENRNAGKTHHRGIELGITAQPVASVSFRFSGAYSQHTFISFVEKGASYNGNEMNAAPNWLYNTELWYRPSFIKGFRLGIEWQHQGAYWLDPQNTARYKGFDVLNVRAGYQRRAFDIWVNVLNAGNAYYAYTASKSSFGYSYNPAEPVNVNIGISYDFGHLFKQ